MVPITEPSFVIGGVDWVEDDEEEEVDDDKGSFARDEDEEGIIIAIGFEFGKLVSGSSI